MDSFILKRKTLNGTCYFLCAIVIPKHYEKFYKMSPESLFSLLDTNVDFISGLSECKISSEKDTDTWSEIAPGNLILTFDTQLNSYECKDETSVKKQIDRISKEIEKIYNL